MAIERTGGHAAAGTEDRPPLPMGRVQVYTGDGKGKTTAAAGLAVRAAAAGLRVLIGQFLKPGDSGEMRALAAAFPGMIDVRGFGSGRFVRGTPSAEDVALARRGLEELREALASGDYGLVVADEASGAVAAGLLSEAELMGLLAARPAHVELVITGRDAPSALTAAADLVTEMRCVKHYFPSGTKARRGIEH